MLKLTQIFILSCFNDLIEKHVFYLLLHGFRIWLIVQAER